MPNALNEFLATATQKAADDLFAALLRLPEDKRGWRPNEKGRTALDQIAECALLNGYTAVVLQNRPYPPSVVEQFSQQMAHFSQDKAALASLDWETLATRLRDSAQKIAEAIRAVPDDALGLEIELPWGKQTVLELMAFCHWNMTYHQGQINYIASIVDDAK